MKKVTDTHIFQSNAQLVGKLSSVLALAGGGQEALLVGPINDLLLEIRKKEKLPIRNHALSAVTSRKIAPLTNRELHVNVPHFLPYITVRGKGVTQTFFNLVPYIRSYDDTQQVNMNRKTLMGMAICATIVNRCETDPSLFMRNSKVLQYGSTVYSRALMKSIDRVYGISQDPVQEDQCRYLLAKFFMLNGMGVAPSERLNSMAQKATGGTNEVIVGNVDDLMEPDDFSSLTTFVGALTRVFPRLAKLTVRGLYKEIVVQYKFTSTLMIEYPPYLFAAVVSTLVNANLINEFAFSTILGQEGIKLFSELETQIG